MPRADVAWCKGCGQHRDEVGPLSWTRLCQKCAVTRVTENVVGLFTMSGPSVERWRRGMAASVGALLVDDLPPQE